MNGDSRIVALARRWPHHTASGGYDRLAREVGADIVLRPDRSEPRPWWRSVLRRWWKWRERHRRSSEFYKYEDWLAAKRLLALARRSGAGAVHILYGEDQLPQFPRLRASLRCPLIATFHLPVAWMKHFENFQNHLVTGIDAAVVLSRCQLNDFKQWLGDDRVFYVPHGIDTQRFVPSGNVQPRNGVMLLTVGDHIRDFNCLRRIVDECNARSLPVRFELVVSRRQWPTFAGCANVHLQTGISEDDLIRAYQEADALLLPVTDATANNAVLESLACGTPVISNAVGGMSDYMDDKCGWLFEKGEVAGVVKLISELCCNKENAGALRDAARRKSLEFDWSIVAGQMRVIYQKVAAGVPPAN